MGPDERILGNLLGVLLVAQELVHHRVDPVPVLADHLVERDFVAGLDSVDEQAVERNFLCLG